LDKFLAIQNHVFKNNFQHLNALSFFSKKKKKNLGEHSSTSTFSFDWYLFAQNLKNHELGILKEKQYIPIPKYIYILIYPSNSNTTQNLPFSLIQSKPNSKYIQSNRINNPSLLLVSVIKEAQIVNSNAINNNTDQNGMHKEEDEEEEKGKQT
jgi:hypothetical protein